MYLLFLVITVIIYMVIIMYIDYKLIGSRIKQFRKEANMTQEILAEKMDVTVGYISQLERGITKISLDTLAKLSVILNCNICAFLENSVPNHELYLCNELSDKLQKMSPNQKKLFVKICDNIMEYT